MPRILDHGVIMSIDINLISGRGPLVDYNWRGEVDRLLQWLQGKDSHIQAFCFDLVMSAAYIDATSGIERSIERCDSINSDYNSHLGFINLCSPCYIANDRWTYQKAVKPQSGALGKLSSEVILRFVEKLYPEISEVIAAGGTQYADAVLKHNNGMIILAEVKSSPLLTYPFLFKAPDSCLAGTHQKLVITSSQLRDCESAIYMHGAGTIKLGKVGTNLWPFKPLVDFFISEENSLFVQNCINAWLAARDAYSRKDRNDMMYYLANASGRPPRIAKDRDGWPQAESISDGKTSAGMDRTDDIKKGIYQSLKIGTYIQNEKMFKTAIISNLPPYRHGSEYVSPFIDMVWGLDEHMEEEEGRKFIAEDNLRRVFDFIITLEDPILREIEI